MQVTANVTAEVRVYRKYYRDVVAIVRKVSQWSVYDYYYYRVLRAICCQPVDGSLICFM